MARPNRKVPDTIRLNLLDQQFGEWTVVGFAGRAGKHILWLCRCSCGRVSEVYADHLVSRRTSRCAVCKSTPEGNKCGSTYHSWTAIKKNGRFIARWRSVSAFHEDMGDRPAGGFLRRKDLSKRFGPSNCYWHVPAKLTRSVAKKIRKTTNFPERRELIEQLREDG